jgi:hypothetical protein
VKHYNPNTSGSAPLFLSGRVYTSFGGQGVPGLFITVNISWQVGGVTYSDSVTLGPTDSNGRARACPAASYPASSQLTVSTDPVANGSGPPGLGLGDVQVQNIPLGSRPAFCN